MYLDLLVSLGSIIARGPYFNVNSTQHHPNEFVVRVGDSAISRKGTGREAVNEVLKMTDPEWDFGAQFLHFFESETAEDNGTAAAKNSGT